MGKISAGAGLGIKLTIGPYQNIDPSFWISWEEEVPEDMTDEQKMARTQEILTVCRQEVEARIDEDIEQITDKKIFANLLKGKK